MKIKRISKAEYHWNRFKDRFLSKSVKYSVVSQSVWHPRVEIQISKPLLPLRTPNQQIAIDLIKKLS